MMVPSPYLNREWRWERTGRASPAVCLRRCRRGTVDDAGRGATLMSTYPIHDINVSNRLTINEHVHRQKNLTGVRAKVQPRAAFSVLSFVCTQIVIR